MEAAGRGRIFPEPSLSSRPPANDFDYVINNPFSAASSASAEKCTLELCLNHCFLIRLGYAQTLLFVSKFLQESYGLAASAACTSAITHVSFPFLPFH
jgi:hypothetical protein